MKVVESIKDIKGFIADVKRQGRTVGLVPTMGNLHDGHMSLIKSSKADCDITVASIFVNPIQFGRNEDFSKYPRTFCEDKARLEGIGTDVLFCPGVKEMYRDTEARTSLYNEMMEAVLCGKFRPGHFSGVMTVVMKLFNIVRPDKAYFGLKDFQQYVIIKNMVKALDMDTVIIGCPIVREKDGLAMSSRNSYLSKEERQDASAIFKALKKIKEKFNGGESSAARLRSIGLEEISRCLSVQYLELADSDTLKSVDKAERGNLVAVAAFCGTTRLIDNIIL
jgi:pantoate--beta-alanine ligase